jgi:hypothetical protein
MDLEEFRAQYSPVLDAAADGSMDDATIASEIIRLRALAETIADPAGRKRAGNLIASIEDVLSYSDAPLSDAMTEAIRVHLRAGADGGTPAERIARAEAGMDEIARISESVDDRSESDAILEMNESLAKLIDAIRTVEPVNDR